MEAIERALDKFENVKSLRKEQHSAIKALVDDKRDTMVLLPTGYGKSLIYQLLPEVHKIRGDQRRIVIVVSPLTAIMKEQTQFLNKNGVRAAILEDLTIDKSNKDWADRPEEVDKSSLGLEVNVEKSCECDSTSKGCSYDVPKFEMMKDASPDIDEHLVKRTITEVDKKEMKAALEVERNRLTILEGGNSVSGEDQLHGFSSLLIEQVILKLPYLGTSKDLIHMLPIFSVSHARIILELIQEFFEDVENFEKEIEELCDDEECTEETRELFTLMQEFYESDEELQEVSDQESANDELDDSAVESALLEELGLSF